MKFLKKLLTILFKSKPKVSLEDALYNAIVAKCRTCKYHIIHKTKDLPDIEFCRKTKDISVDHFILTKNHLSQWDICVKEGFIYYEEKMIN
jgi:hypothetical protein